MLNNSNTVNLYRVKTNSILMIIEEIFNSGLNSKDKISKIRVCLFDWRESRPYQCGAIDKISFPAQHKISEFLKQLSAEKI